MSTFSGLTDAVKISPNNSGTRLYPITRITPHCWVGQVRTVDGLNAFANPLKKVSSNYIIGKDGTVGGCVPEEWRSWCSSSRDNDNRAITIECASDTVTPYTFNDCVYNKLVDLCTDICKRYNKDTLLWIPDKEQALNYQPKNNEMLLTVHRWFANKACPGNWLMSKLPMLAEEVTGRLKVPTPTPKKEDYVMVEAKVLKKGMAGPEVVALQTLLKGYGYKGANNRVLTVDGDFGNNTLYALTNYQKTFCTPDGICGAKTWTHLLNG